MKSKGVTQSKDKIRKVKGKKYEVTNVLPLFLLGDKGLNDSEENINESRLVDEQGKLIYNKIKYNLSDLFEHTPVFDEAPVSLFLMIYLIIQK